MTEGMTSEVTRADMIEIVQDRIACIEYERDHLPDYDATGLVIWRALLRELEAGGWRPTLDHAVTKPIVAITREDLIYRLRSHVRSRGAPSVPNGAWALMLEAARQLEAISPPTTSDGTE